MADSPGEERTLRSDSDAHHVDVQQAEYVFNQLSRALSQRSDRDPALKCADVEKAGEDQHTRFDLREYLSSSNDQTQAAGISHKHVGVTWDDLQVAGFGGAGHKVSPLSASILRRKLTCDRQRGLHCM